MATTNDIVFGVNTNETSSGSADGKPIKVTTGAGAIFIKKIVMVTAVAKVVHDAGKTFGTTYYGFGMGG